MRALWKLLASLAVVALLVAACGGDGDDSDAAGSESSSEASSDEIASSDDGDAGDDSSSDASASSDDGEDSSGQDDAEAASESPAGTLRGVYRVGFATWDPHNDQRTASFSYLDPVYESLIREVPDGGEFVPQLATAWEEDESGITFTLREGVTFHDGEPFNADAVVANLERVRTSGHPTNQNFMRNVASVEAVDDLTVRVNFTAFDPTVMQTLSRFSGRMISPAAFPTEENPMTVPIGTGPWAYDAEGSAADLTLLAYDANTDWWGGETGRAARIELTFTSDQNAMLNGLLAGEFDVIPLTGNANRAAAEAGGMEVHVKPTNGWAMLIQDREGTINPELADPRVRQAMVLAADGVAYTTAIDLGTPSRQFGIEGGYGYSENIADSDLDAAKALMAEAGNPEFTLMVPTGPPFNNRNGYFASAWAELGITVETVDVGNAQFPACFSGEYAAAICPINEFSMRHFVENRLLNGGNLNPFGVVNDEIEALYAEASTLSAEEAEPIYIEIMEIAAEDGVHAWVAWGSSPVASNPETVSGVDLRFFHPTVPVYEDIRVLNQ